MCIGINSEGWRRNPLVRELSLYDVVGTEGVAADISHINSRAQVELPAIRATATAETRCPQPLAPLQQGSAVLVGCMWGCFPGLKGCACR